MVKCSTVYMCILRASGPQACLSRLLRIGSYEDLLARMHLRARALGSACVPRTAGVRRKVLLRTPGSGQSKPAEGGKMMKSIIPDPPEPKRSLCTKLVTLHCSQHRHLGDVPSRLVYRISHRAVRAIAATAIAITAIYSQKFCVVCTVKMM